MKNHINSPRHTRIAQLGVRGGDGTAVASNPTLDRLRSEQDYLNGELRTIHEAAGDDPLDDDTQARWDEGVTAVQEREEQIQRLAARLEVLSVASRRGSGGSEPGSPRPERDGDPLGDHRSVEDDRRFDNPWDFDAISRAHFGSPAEAMTELRSRALTAIERSPGLADQHRAAVTELIERLSLDADDDDAYSGAAKVARHVLAVSSPEYIRAFSKVLRTFGKTGQPDPAALQVLSRAASLTDSAGGYAVPLPIDPTLIKNYDVDVNPFRAIATVRPATTDVVRTVNSTAVAASWDGEAGEVSDDATTFANIDITLHKAQAFVPFSIEIGQDYPNFTEDVADLIRDGRDDLEAAAFATGTGTNQPIGIVTALTGGSFEVASNTADTFALGDVYDLEEELEAQWRARASWTANKRIYQAVREAGGANLDDFWANLREGQPPRLLGYPAFESSSMDGVINAAAENYVLVLGDFSQYRIYDRAGLSIELVPHLFATANNRPSGQRGFYAWWRVGADSVNDRAFRMLNVT